MLYLKRIEWDEEKPNAGKLPYFYVSGGHPIISPLVEWNSVASSSSRLYHAYLGDEYLDSYTSLESAKKACQDELDRIVMSCIEIEREWRE